MLELEGLGEYNNSGALLGLDGVEHEELLGALKRMNPIQRMKVMNKIAGGVPASKGSRAEMEKHFAELPQHIKDGLLKGELRLADTIVYSRKLVNSKTIKLFETQDVKEVGMRNISNAKLPKNQALLVSGIFLLVGQVGANDNPTNDKIISAKYGKVEDFGAIANGEFTLKANKKIIMADVDNAVFKTANNTTLPVGYYKLSNPRVVQDDIQLEATVELGSLDGIDTAKTFLYVGLHGTITTP
ncbi:MAG: hypothetical protein ACJ77K_06450 [Bacteroidia bacterium]